MNYSKSFPKYKQNLSKVENPEDGGIYIKSYDTLVARIVEEKDELWQLGWWSVTTQKHINYAASELGLTLVKLHEMPEYK